MAEDHGTPTSASEIGPTIVERPGSEPDGAVSPGGAEDIEYLSLPQPYRSANQPLQSVEELRLVKGFTAKIVEKLRPYVTALPVPTTINVNTAPDQVLAALFTNLPAAALQPVLDSRVSQPFADATQFIARLPSGTPAPPASLYGINTGYFLVTIDIRYGRLQRRTEALIERSSGKPATVLWHRLPPLQFATAMDGGSAEREAVPTGTKAGAVFP